MLSGSSLGALRELVAVAGIETQLGTNFHFSFVIVPIDSIVHPLCMFPDDGSNQTNKYFVVLPKRNWSRYFGKNIHIH
jgi:hypothetical protein